QFRDVQVDAAAHIQKGQHRSLRIAQVHDYCGKIVVVNRVPQLDYFWDLHQLVQGVHELADERNLETDFLNVKANEQPVNVFTVEPAHRSAALRVDMRRDDFLFA